jgi:hypothetical protein
VQRARERLDEELAKVEDLRDPPVPVTAWLVLDGCDRDGLLYGWSADPRGADDGLRGLVVAVREYAPGFFAEYCGWVGADHIRRRVESAP